MAASTFLTRLDQGEWLRHQHSALASAHDIARKIAIEVGKCFFFLLRFCIEGKNIV